MEKALLFNLCTLGTIGHQSSRGGLNIKQSLLGMVNKYRGYMHQFELSKAAIMPHLYTQFSIMNSLVSTHIYETKLVLHVFVCVEIVGSLQTALQIFSTTMCN